MTEAVEIQIDVSETSSEIAEVNQVGLEKTTDEAGQFASLKKVGKKANRSMEAGRILPTGICLSKAAIGAGVLSMAAHSAQVGLLYQFIGLVVGGILNIVSIRMIAQASVTTDRFSFEDISDELFHPGLAVFTGFINATNAIGSAVAYLILCGQIFQVLCGTNDEWRRIFIILLGVFVCMPLALARHINFMRHLATLSVFALLFLVIVVVQHVAQDGPDDSLTMRNLWLGQESISLFAYINALNNVIFAYNNSANVPQLTGETHPVPNTRRMGWAAALATFVCFLLYFLVSLLGVLAFGVGANQKDTLILDFEVDRKSPLVILALAGVMFSILTCFQFHIFPIRQFAAYLTRKARGRQANDESDDRTCCGKPLTRLFDISAALVSVAMTILIAVAVTKLMTVLDFIGAFAAAYLAYVIPPLMLIQIRRLQKGGDFSWLSMEVGFCVAMHILGLFFFVFGTYSAVHG
mmetsp:Transcript_27494/g.49763  ORF Transcript_27494/g.49763 Transcript_27494/m.49763 type:complete len:466 (+) Transcript_27494:33-1430(+)